MATALEVVRFARTFIGYREDPPGTNRTRFGEAYGMDGVPWCAMFTWFLLEKNGVPIIRSAYTPTIAEWFKAQKRGFTNEREILPGDLLFFDFPDSVARIQHIEIATGRFGALRAGVVTTIGGNTSSGLAGSQDNGGGVFARERGAEEIVYIGRPDYEDPKEKLPRFDVPKSKTFFGPGDSGADVLTWQRDLNRWMAHLRKTRKNLEFDFGKIDADGRFGRETVKATKTFQNAYDLDVDGRVGQHTERKMEKVRARQKAA